MNPTHGELVERAGRWLRNSAVIPGFRLVHKRKVKCGVVLTEMVSNAQETPDAIGCATAPSTTEVNVKVTVKGKDGGVTQELPEMIKDKDDENYKVVAPPIGATVPYIPDETDEKMIGGKKYFVYADTYYRPYASDGETIYMVVEKPKKSTS